MTSRILTRTLVNLLTFVILVEQIQQTIAQNSAEPQPQSASPVTANETRPSDSSSESSEVREFRIQNSLALGADFLLNQQNTDGSICDKSHRLAITSLAIMALTSIGHTPDGNSEHSQAVKKALEFVLLDSHQDEQGYFGASDGSNMYGHGITTLMLTELQGMGDSRSQNRVIQERAEKALKLIQSAQQVPKQRKSRGGWRYQPNSPDADLSISVWQLMALRSAKNDGTDIPNQSIQLALDYLRNSFTGRIDSNGEAERPSGFAYLPGSRSPSFAMTAAGLLAMQVCGQYDSPEARSAADWLLQTPPNWNHPHAQYGTYYYSQAMHQRGGKYAQTARMAVSDMLLPVQKKDGSFLAKSNRENSQGLVYTTSMAMLSLSVQKHYLPIYQR